MAPLCSACIMYRLCLYEYVILHETSVLIRLWYLGSDVDSLMS